MIRGLQKEEQCPIDGSCSSLLFCGNLHQLGYGLCILALIETGLKNRLVLEIDEAEQLEGTELTVVAQAKFQPEVAVGTVHRLAILLNVGNHLGERHV